MGREALPLRWNERNDHVRWTQSYLRLPLPMEPKPDEHPLPTFGQRSVGHLNLGHHRLLFIQKQIFLNYLIKKNCKILKKK